MARASEVNPRSSMPTVEPRHAGEAPGAVSSWASSAAPRIAWVATIAYWSALIFVTHIPPNQLPQTHVNDKVEHFVSYALLTGLLLFAMARGGGGLKMARAAGAVAIVLVS